MRTRKRHLKPGQRGEPLMAALIFLLVGKLVVEVALGAYVHPIHWLAASIISGVSAIVTVIWYRWLRPNR